MITIEVFSVRDVFRQLVEQLGTSNLSASEAVDLVNQVSSQSLSRDRLIAFDPIVDDLAKGEISAAKQRLAKELLVLDRIHANEGPLAELWNKLDDVRSTVEGPVDVRGMFDACNPGFVEPGTNVGNFIGERLNDVFRQLHLRLPSELGEDLIAVHRATIPGSPKFDEYRKQFNSWVSSQMPLAANVSIDGLSEQLVALHSKLDSGLRKRWYRRDGFDAAESPIAVYGEGYFSKALARLLSDHVLFDGDYLPRYRLGANIATGGVVGGLLLLKGELGFELDRSEIGDVGDLALGVDIEVAGVRHTSYLGPNRSPAAQYADAEATIRTLGLPPGSVIVAAHGSKDGHISLEVTSDRFGGIKTVWATPQDLASISSLDRVGNATFNVSSEATEPGLEPVVALTDCHGREIGAEVREAASVDLLIAVDGNFTKHSVLQAQQRHDRHDAKVVSPGPLDNFDFFVPSDDDPVLAKAIESVTICDRVLSFFVNPTIAPLLGSVLSEAAADGESNLELLHSYRAGALRLKDSGLEAALNFVNMFSQDSIGSFGFSDAEELELLNAIIELALVHAYGGQTAKEVDNFIAETLVMDPAEEEPDEKRYARILKAVVGSIPSELASQVPELANFNLPQRLDAEAYLHGRRMLQTAVYRAMELGSAYLFSDEYPDGVKVALSSMGGLAGLHLDNSGGIDGGIQTPSPPAEVWAALTAGEAPRITYPLPRRLRRDPTDSAILAATSSLRRDASAFGRPSGP